MSVPAAPEVAQRARVRGAPCLRRETPAAGIRRNSGPRRWPGRAAAV